jgi:hypothetical protein
MEGRLDPAKPAADQGAIPEDGSPPGSDIA